MMRRYFVTFLKFGLIAFSLTGMILMTGCGDDDTVVDPLVGKYVLSNATVASALTITLPGDSDPSTLEEGTPITEIIGGILAAASPCVNPVNTAIELAADGTLFYICVGEDVNSVDSGEWSSDTDSNTITLIIQSEAFSTPLTVVVKNYTISVGSFSGLIEGFPVPKDANESLGILLSNGSLNFQFASINATFTKLP